MFPMLSPHLRAILQAVFVTFLWSTSWVLIKIGLEGIPPLTFAGLRYSLAFLCLLPFAARRVAGPAGWAPLRALPASAWLRLVVLGLLFYTLTQGAQFVGLRYLPAVTVNLLLTFTTVVVALLGLAFLAERPTPLQWGGMLLALSGAFVYFYPVVLLQGQGPGYLALAVGILANALSSILGRAVNRGGSLSPLLVTTITMGIGAGLLLAAGLVLQGLPRLTLVQWAIVIWLAVVNTAFAFTLWNQTLRTLTAVESSVINNTMIVQIPLLAWLFLGEPLTAQRIAGLALAGVGALIVQLRRRVPAGPAPQALGQLRLSRKRPAEPEG